MPVVGIGHMGMGVGDGFMPMPMAVHAAGHRIVYVVVVSVVMAVRVFVLKRFVGVHVGVGFRQVQEHPRQHQQSGHDHRPRAGAVTQGPGAQSADERRKGEHRAGAGCTKAALRQQIKPQAQAIARGAYRHQSQSTQSLRHGLGQQPGQNACAHRAQRGFDQNHLARIAIGDTACHFSPYRVQSVFGI